MQLIISLRPWVPAQSRPFTARLCCICCSCGTSTWGSKTWKIITLAYGQTETRMSDRAAVGGWRELQLLFIPKSLRQHHYLLCTTAHPPDNVQARMCAFQPLFGSQAPSRKGFRGSLCVHTLSLKLTRTQTPASKFLRPYSCNPATPKLCPFSVQRRVGGLSFTKTFLHHQLKT